MKRTFIFLLLFSIPFLAISQEKELTSKFSEYSKLPRELIYVHLNKTTFLNGENLAFKAYVSDKALKAPSLQTNNLYCALLNEKDSVVKSKLLRVENGVANGMFFLDSTINNGSYKFQAYTNWIKNFSEPNQFEHSIKIISDCYKKQNAPLEEIDAQFLPEGGYALTDVESVFGVIIKDKNGLGLANVKGEIFDSENNPITTFVLNNMGIGRFLFTPRKGVRYSANFSINDKNHIIPLNHIEVFGAAIKLQDLRDKIGLTLTVKSAKNKNLQKPYKLTIHNGDSIKVIQLSFSEKSQQSKLVSKNYLFSGINIFTLFNGEDEPLLERLFFNYDRINIAELENATAVNKKDSIHIKIPAHKYNKNSWNSLSISVLPETTQANNPDYTFPCYLHLKPYVKGFIENSSYYFKNITPKKKYELDNLLITQGWSAYQWNTILNKPPKYRFEFEKGITYKVTVNSAESNQFFVFPTLNHKSEFVNLPENTNTFIKENFFPLDDEKLAISEIDKKGEMAKPKLFVEFKPSVFPTNPIILNSSPDSESIKYDVSEDVSFFETEGLSNVQELEEITIKEFRKNEEEVRQDKITRKSFGQVDFFTPDDSRRSLFLSSYLSQKGFVVSESLGQFSITTRRPNSFNNNRPAILLDGVLLGDYSVLFRFSLDVVDYIEINSSGIGAGIQGGAGIIKIVTDPTKTIGSLKKQVQTNYSIPLGFSVAKRFYSPLYTTYTGKLFNSYGAIDWFPNVKLDDTGNISFKVLDVGVEKMKIFIEGIVDKDKVISEVHQIKL